MPSSQRESPLKPKQDDKQACQQRVADVIHQGNREHNVAFLFLHHTLAPPEKAAQQCRTLKRDRYVERERRQIVMWYEDLRPMHGAIIIF